MNQEKPDEERLRGDKGDLPVAYLRRDRLFEDIPYEIRDMGDWRRPFAYPQEMKDWRKWLSW